jgi:formate dehydrogenase subunit delta
MTAATTPVAHEFQHLVSMANDIAHFYSSQGHDEAVEGIANHVRSYWTPRMREKILSQLAAGESELEEPLEDLPREALRLLEKHPSIAPDHPPGGDAG